MLFMFCISTKFCPQNLLFLKPHNTDVMRWIELTTPRYWKHFRHQSVSTTSDTENTEVTGAPSRHMGHPCLGNWIPHASRNSLLGTEQKGWLLLQDTPPRKYLCPSAIFMTLILTINTNILCPDAQETSELSYQFTGVHRNRLEFTFACLNTGVIVF